MYVQNRFFPCAYLYRIFLTKRGSCGIDPVFSLWCYEHLRMAEGHPVASRGLSGLAVVG